MGRELSFVKESFQKVSYELLEREDQVSKLGLEVNSIAVRTRNEAESRYSEELQEKERMCSRAASEVQTLRSSLALAEQDRDYHEENYRRATSEAFALRSQISQLQEQADELANQLYFKTQEANKLQSAVDAYREQADEFGMQADEAYRMRTEIFSLKSDVSNLQEEVFGKEAANARLAN